jgi:DNA polymerase I-like protein with 3'-5' exonuclease and polymerase domains
VNFQCQSAAADIAKWAMVKVAEAIRKHGLQAELVLCLQIHDELLFCVKDSRLSEAAKLIRDTLQGVVCAPGMWHLAVPMPIKLSCGPNWGELAEVDV